MFMEMNGYGKTRKLRIMLGLLLNLNSPENCFAFDVGLPVV